MKTKHNGLELMNPAQHEQLSSFTLQQLIHSIEINLEPEQPQSIPFSGVQHWGVQL